MRDKIIDILRSRDICVLATVSGNRPHCSLMAYSTDDKCGELYMLTLRDTEKFRNLKDNPGVSILIDTREDNRKDHRVQASALTVEGTAGEVTDPPDMRFIKAKLLADHPRLKELADLPDCAILRVKIDSFLLLDGLRDAHYEKP